MSDEDPFKLWEDSDAPREDDQRKSSEMYTETVGPDGEVVIQIFPSVPARMMAATIAGQFKALLDTKMFDREEALRIVLKTMSAVVIHTGDGDEDE